MCFQLCGNSLGKALSCFSMTMTPCTKWGQYRNDLLRSVWENLTGLHKALTSTPSNNFCDELKTQSVSQAKSTDISARPHKFSCGWMEETASSNVSTSSGKSSQKSGGCYSSKGETKSILMPMILEWDGHTNALSMFSQVCIHFQLIQLPWMEIIFFNYR